MPPAKTRCENLPCPVYALRCLLLCTSRPCVSGGNVADAGAAARSDVSRRSEASGDAMACPLPVKHSENKHCWRTVERKTWCRSWGDILSVNILIGFDPPLRPVRSSSNATVHTFYTYWHVSRSKSTGPQQAKQSVNVCLPRCI